MPSPKGHAFFQNLGLTILHKPWRPACRSPQSRHIPFLRPNSCQALQLTSVACIGWSSTHRIFHPLILKRLSLKTSVFQEEIFWRPFTWDTDSCGMTAKKKKKTLGLALPLLVVWPWKHLITPFWTLYHPTPACPNFIKHQTSRVGKDFK